MLLRAGESVGGLLSCWGLRVEGERVGGDGRGRALLRILALPTSAVVLSVSWVIDILTIRSSNLG